MPFSGKATYSAGPTLPELAQDVSDIIGIVSPYETPLLDHLGDPQRSATSTVHEWLEDRLLPNTDAVDGAVTVGATSIDIDHGDRFRVGDQVQPEGSREVLFVTAVGSNTLRADPEHQADVQKKRRECRSTAHRLPGAKLLFSPNPIPAKTISVETSNFNS